MIKQDIIIFLACGLIVVFYSKHIKAFEWKFLIAEEINLPVLKITLLICILQELEVFCNTDKRYIDKNSPYKFIAHVFRMVSHSWW